MMLNGWLKNTTDMETKFNFRSQVCTSVEQSRRLLALGLKKETADMHWFYTGKIHGWQCCVQCYQDAIAEPFRKEDATNVNILPAWSLHRLIEMMPNNIHKYNDIADLSVSNELVQYRFYDVDYNHDVCLEHFNDRTLYNNIIDCIEWLIKEGYFNTKYLNGTAEN